MIGQFEYPIQLFGFQGYRRRIEPHITIPVGLNKRQRVVGIRFFMKNPRCVGIQNWIVGYRLGGGESNGMGVWVWGG